MACMMCLRDRPRSFGDEPEGKKTLVAMTTSSRRASSRSARPVTSSLAPFEYMSAVSKKLIPPSMARTKKGRAASSSRTHERHFDDPYVMQPRQRRETLRPVLPRVTYFIRMQNAECKMQKQIARIVFAFCILHFAFACSPPPPPTTQPSVPPPPPEISTIVVPLRASLAPLLPLIEAQVPKSVTQIDAYELDPSKRFGLKYQVLRDPIVLNMQNAGLHASAHVRYALEGCVNGRQRMWPCISCGFGEPMREATIELQSRFDWAENWTLRSKTTARPVEFASSCTVTALNIDITDWKLRPIVEQQLQDVAKTIDHNTPKLAAIRPQAQQVWSSLQTPFAIAPKTWLVIEPVDVALAPIRGSGLTVTSVLALHARTRVVFGEKPTLATKPLPALRTATTNDGGIRIPFDVEMPFGEVSRLLTEQFGKRTYAIEGG